MKRLKTIENLSPSYLFQEIEKRKTDFLKSHPNTELISLGIGDTILPLSSSVSSAMERAAAELGTEEGYSGYGKGKGLHSLCEALATNIYDNQVSPDEIFISDGGKCDIGRLQVLFQSAQSVGVQDPAYPVYLDGSIIQGIREIVPLPCTPHNNFFPTLPEGLDLIYICNPNNPTGVAYSHAQLKCLVDSAQRSGAIILYDAAYFSYIQDPSLPKSIYEIEGARNVAIEVNSFSKMVGFTGVRLGWTVVPEELCYECGHSVSKDWHRLCSTIFNGASNIAQKGGLAVFEDENWRESGKFYMENARLLKEAFKKSGASVFGGENAPYLWVHHPGESSWDLFQHYLEKKQIIVTPGVGYGPSGESFIRVSAFAKREEIDRAIELV